MTSLPECIPAYCSMFLLLFSEKDYFPHFSAAIVIREGLYGLYKEEMYLFLFATHMLTE